MKMKETGTSWSFNMKSQLMDGMHGHFDLSLPFQSPHSIIFDSQSCSEMGRYPDNNQWNQGKNPLDENLFSFSEMCFPNQKTNNFNNYR